MRTVVVIPTYNERMNILPLIERCMALPIPLDLFLWMTDPRTARANISSRFAVPIHA